jgi:putative phosphoesterase
MKRILLLSDSHGYIDSAVLEHCADADQVWHAGDIGTVDVTDQIKEVATLRAVYGNIDGTELRAEFPLHQRFICEGVDVWITHIGGYPGRYSPAIRNEIRVNPPDLFICGHSHILKVMRDQKLNLIHMNPGAIGKHGFHKSRTMLRFVLDQGRIDQLEVIEFKR